MNTISDIFAPRFKDRKVLVAPYRIQPGMNRIIFSKTMKDKAFYMDASKMKSYPQESNGTIGCYAIPLADFEVKKVNEDQMELL